MISIGNMLWWLGYPDDVECTMISFRFHHFNVNCAYLIMGWQASFAWMACLTYEYLIYSWLLYAIDRMEKMITCTQSSAKSLQLEGFKLQMPPGIVHRMCLYDSNSAYSLFMGIHGNRFKIRTNQSVRVR